MFSLLNKRSIFGFSESGKRCPQPIDLTFLLTKYKNYCNDEYSTLDDDGMSVPPMACRFARGQNRGHILGVVDEDGCIVMYDIDKCGQKAVLKTWQVHSNAVFDMEWLEDDSQILTASGDQTIALWDVQKRVRLESFRGHSSSVRSIALRLDDNAIFASGSRDGHIMIWDKRVVHKDGAIAPVNVIYNAHALQQYHTPSKARKKKQHLLQPKDGQQSVTAVLFQDENYLVSAGSVDGCIKVWDIRKTYKKIASGATPARVLHYPGRGSRKHGYSSLTFDQSRCHLFASCTDDTIYEYNISSFEDRPVYGYKGHKNTSFYVKTAVSPNNQFLLSGSSDHHAYIWQINKPEIPPVVLKAHDAEVSGVEWCQTDFTKLVTLSDDAKTKFWRIRAREVKSDLHPQWFGRATRLSKNRATSTIGLSFKPSPSTSTSSPHGKLSTPTDESRTLASPKSVSKSPSLREWLKRKPSVDLEGISKPLPNKTLRGAPGKEMSINRCTSQLARPDTAESTKRSLDLKKNISEIDKIIGISSNIQTESPPRKKARIEDGLGESSKSCFSPVKPNRSQKSLCENIHHPSPQKLKHGLNLDHSSASPPKRPCLTKLDTNGAFHRLSSVRQSLFGNVVPPENELLKEECDVSNEKEKSCDLDSGLPKPKMYEESIGDSKNSLSSTLLSDAVANDIESVKPKIKSPENLNSPTHNLPNLVMDQLSNMNSKSPQLSTPPHVKRVDWLTQLRLNKIGSEEESVSLKQQTPSPARSSPKMSQRIKMKKIRTYFIGQHSQGNITN